MFYLLEDNPTGIRILDDKNNEIEHIQIKDMKDEMKINSYSSIKVIKYSENVFDLIDKKQDLIKIDSQIIMAKTIMGNIKNLSGITAIYKPNSKGDYIKVWEKKDNEVK